MLGWKRACIQTRWHILKVVQAPLKGEKYLAVHTAWCQELVTKSFSSLQDSYVGNAKSEVEINVVGALLYIYKVGMLKNKIVYP